MVDQKTRDIMMKRFAELPTPVQKAITSADIQMQLRGLADKHKLHLDQWEVLENEVLMALFGITPVEELESSIQKEIGVSAETAVDLATDISRIVFEPIRQELERELEHPDAKAKESSGVETARTQALADKPVAQPATPVIPATPPAPPPTQKAVRGPGSGAYSAGTASSARKDVRDDPYRESPA